MFSVLTEHLNSNVKFSSEILDLLLELINCKIENVNLHTKLFKNVLKSLSVTKASVRF